MGYQVSSILAISPDDQHAFFIYYLPAKKFKNRPSQWINDYIYENFGQIAASVGPDGVIVAPTQGNAGRYIESISELSSGGSIFSQYQFFKDKEKEGPEKYLHSGEPYLIVSDTPIHSGKGKANGIVINLNGIENEVQIGEVIDAIIDGIHSRSITKIAKAIPSWEGAYEKNNLSKYTAMLELKPNVFGLGVNLNAVINYINRKFIKNSGK